MSMTRLNPRGLYRIVNGQRYTVNTATLLADNDTWDGQNFTKGGRNTFLYRTARGAFFRVDMTCWQGERDTITPIDREQAMALYESLPEHYVEYEAAFDVVVEEAEPDRGRPPLFSEPMTRVNVYLTQDQIVWLRAQDLGMAETLRNLVNEAIHAEKQ